MRLCLPPTRTRSLAARCATVQARPTLMPKKPHTGMMPRRRPPPNSFSPSTGIPSRTPNVACYAIKAAGSNRRLTIRTTCSTESPAWIVILLTWWRRRGIRSGVDLSIAQSAFFSVPRLPEETRWLHNSLLRKPQPELCFGCHGNIQAEFALPTHHRVPEGAMTCTDCHNTHGSSNFASLRQNGSETCTHCHTEKRGPFVFEHAAAKVEGCTACHTPHGSVNRKLLVRREERLLCLQCHVNPFAANVPHSRLSFQTRGDCTRCHATIHGSNFDANFIQ